VVVGGKEGLGPQTALVGAVFQHAAGDGHTIVSRSTAANLVQNEQGAAGGVLQKPRHLGHLHHKGGLARGQVVAGPDAGKHPVHDTDAGASGGDKGADLGHEDDKGHLSHIGGLTGHVGAGDDGAQIAVVVHMGVVRDKQRPFQHLFHHGMATLGDGDGGGVVHLGHTVVVRGGHGGQRVQRVHLSHGGGAGLNGVHPGADLLAQLAEKLIFQGRHLVLSGQNGVLQLLEFLRNIPLGVHRGLLSRPVGGDQIGLGLGHLDIVSKYLIGLDLHVLDAGLLAGSDLQLSQTLSGVFQQIPVLVHLRMEAGADKAALPDGEGRFLHQRGGEQLPQFGQVVQLPAQGSQQGGGTALQQFPQTGQLAQSVGKGHQITPTGGAVDHPADEALQVGDLPQGGGKLLPDDDVLHQIGDGLLAAADLHRGEEGSLDPAPQQPPAHGGFGLVQHPQKGALLILGAQGGGQLQSLPGGEIQLHVLPGGIVGNGGNVA